MERMKEFTEEVSRWPQVSVYSHRFGGLEFRFANAEIGHVHEGGAVDIPFPRAVRDVLLAEGLADKHHWVPHSGWVTFRIRKEEDVKHALWLMRLSYVRYALKTAESPREFLEHEGKALQLTPTLMSVLKKFIAQPGNAPLMGLPTA